MPTVAEIKKGVKVYGKAIYKNDPYIMLNKNGVVLAGCTMNEILNSSIYYDDCIVGIRARDLSACNNEKIKKTYGKLKRR